MDQSTARQQIISSTMKILFGQKKTLQELMRQNQLALDGAMHEIDRERQELEMSEKNIIADIKEKAKLGQIDSVRILAKDLIRRRQYVKKLLLMKTHIRAGSLNMLALNTQNAMAQVMLLKQSSIMDIKEEIMKEAFNDAMGDVDDEQESETVVQQVLDELGIQMSEVLNKIPTPVDSLATSGKESKQAEGISALQARLENLRRD